jgi:hypothetical protein
MARNVVVLTRRPEQGQVLAAPDGEADPLNRRNAAIANDEVGDLDPRLGHRNSPENRRVARNMMASATNTADV